MKTIIEKTTNISKYIFEDADAVTMSTSMITTPNFVIGDMNSTNATMIEGVTAPADWAGNKYKYENGSWAANPDWVDPATLEE